MKKLFVLLIVSCLTLSLSAQKPEIYESSDKEKMSIYLSLMEKEYFLTIGKDETGEYVVLHNNNKDVKYKVIEDFKDLDHNIIIILKDKHFPIIKMNPTNRTVEIKQVIYNYNYEVSEKSVKEWQAKKANSTFKRK